MNSVIIWYGIHNAIHDGKYTVDKHFRKYKSPKVLALEIERGRHTNIEVNERLCTYCERIDDERHHILYCDVTGYKRQCLFEKVNCHYPDLMILRNSNIYWCQRIPKYWGHETMVCVVCLSIFLWIRDMAKLLRRKFVSWWYLPRIWPSVTDIQHYYHARYPIDNWHLAYMFSLVYFSVDVCLVGVFPHSISTRRDPCLRVCAPVTLASPLTRKQKSNWGWPGSPLEPSEGAFELTHGSACTIGW